MAVNVSDLPPDLRRQIEAEHGTTTRKRAKPSRTPTGTHTPGHCGTLGCDWIGNDRHPHPDKCRKTKPCDCFVAHMLETGHPRFVMKLEATDG